MGRPRTKLIINEAERPLCINDGCDKLVTVSAYYSNGTAKWRPVCGHCSQAQTGRIPYADGVSPFKKNKCSNKDGRLGFKCAVNFKLLPKEYSITEMDHIDGDDTNNCKENVQELCVICHKIKSQQCNDLIPNARNRKLKLVK
jgi:hypothetical protein